MTLPLGAPRVVSLRKIGRRTGAPSADREENFVWYTRPRKGILQIDLPAILLRVLLG